MAFCENCGQELPTEAKFCYICGTPTEPVSNNLLRKTVYDGEVHKCPNCGETLDSFITKCPACGYELRGIRQNGCVHDLAKRLQDEKTAEQKHELISNFYIPNTREDIYEFFILADSNIMARDEAMDAWLAKLEQAYLKAKLAFGDDQEFAQIDASYKKICREYKRKKIIGISKSKVFQAFALIFLGILMVAIGEKIGIGLLATILVFGGIPFIILGCVHLVVPRKIRKK